MTWQDLRTKKGNLLSFCLIFSCCLFTGTVISSFKADPAPLATATVKQVFIRDVQTLLERSAQLTRSLELYHPQEGSVARVQDSFYAVKEAYKKVEFLLEYLDPETAKSLNGAPLPRILIEEANYQSLSFVKPVVRTFPPEGLQVMEETLFGDSLSAKEIQEAFILATKFEEKVALFTNGLFHQTFTDKQVLESLREEVIRVITMGLTGFDAPAAGRELEHARRALLPVLATAVLYRQQTTGAAQAQSRKATASLQQALDYIGQHPDFEDFDRLFFIRDLLDPAYGAMTALQQELAGTPASWAKPVNDQARSIFAPGFIQASYYAKQDRQQARPELIELGRALFFDPVLSANKERSCASCHQPEKAFTDGRARSIAFGFKGQLTRNSPTLLNAVFSNAYFWDSRALYLQDQVPDVVVNAAELHGNYAEVVQDLQQSPHYRKLFKKAFAQPAEAGVNVNAINRAIAAYVQRLVSLNTPFDRYMRRETEVLGASAKRGFNLFMGKAACGTCHFAPLFNGTVPPRFTDSESEVLGVPVTADLTRPALDPDLGRGGVIPADALNHSFKTPTVRNAALTAPYMHNGAFNTLEEVVEFYDRGGGAGIGLTVPNQTLPAEALHLSTGEKQDLVAFMQALTDTVTVHSAPKKLPRLSGKGQGQKRLVGGRY